MIFLHPNPSGVSSPSGPQAAPRFTLRQALALSSRQLNVIDPVRAILQHMARLARAAHQDAVSPGQPAVVEFQKLAAQIQRLTGEEFQGVKLFAGGTLTVDLAAGGNQLIMAEANLNRAPYLAIRTASIDQPALAAHACGVITQAIQQLAIEESILVANLNHLQFCLQHTEPFASSSRDNGSVGESLPPWLAGAPDAGFAVAHDSTSTLPVHAASG